MINSIKEANRLFQAGLYKDAERVYKSLKSKNYPDILIQPNLELLKKRIVLDEGLCSDYSTIQETLAYNYVDKKCSEYLERNRVSKNSELVSIIIPARNCASYIERTIVSLQNQSHENIEIIFVDDFSEDETREIVRKISKDDRRVKYFRLNANLGTYFARSYGISVANGDYISFQDADDFSHRDRIAIHLNEIKKNDFLVITSNFIRFNIVNGEIIDFHNKIENYGFITTFANKKLFESIGTFDLTNRGGDAEFSLRIKRNVEKERVKHIPIPTYLASDMPGSLSHGEVDRNNSNKSKALSFSRYKYSRNFSSILQTIKSHQLKEVFKFPMLRSPYNIPRNLLNSDISMHRIIGFMKMSRDNIGGELSYINSISTQVDFLYIYCEFEYGLIDKNEFNFLKNVNFIFLDEILTSVEILFLTLKDAYERVKSDFLIVGFEDGVVYPPDYTHTIFNRLKSLQFCAVLGLQGVDFSKNEDEDEDEDELIGDKNYRLCDVIDSRSIAFSSQLIGPKGIVNLGECVTDYLLAKFFRERAIPCYRLLRNGDFFQSLSFLKEFFETNNFTKSIEDEKFRDLKYSWSGRRDILISNIIDVGEAGYSGKIYLSFSELNKNIWSLNFSGDHIYKIIINPLNKREVNYSVVLANKLTGNLISTRENSVFSSHILCNSSVNKSVLINLKSSSHSCVDAGVFFGLEITKIVDAYPVLEKNDKDTTISGCLATYPAREDCLEDLFQSVLPQFDKMYIYLNRYEDIPDIIRKSNRNDEGGSSIEYILDKSGRPKASGKFRWIDHEGYIFTLDDDIIYPENYVEYLIGWIEKFKRRAFVGVHGLIFEENVKNFHVGDGNSIQEKINFNKSLENSKRVHLIGTGTMAFHSSLIKDFKDEIFNIMNPRSENENANDESLAVFSKLKGIPMYLVPRTENWLKSNKKMKYGIFEDHFNDPQLANSVLSLLASANPWPNFKD